MGPYSITSILTARGGAVYQKVGPSYSSVRTLGRILSEPCFIQLKIIGELLPVVLLLRMINIYDLILFFTTINLHSDFFFKVSFKNVHLGLSTYSWSLATQEAY